MPWTLRAVGKSSTNDDRCVISIRHVTGRLGKLGFRHDDRFHDNGTVLQMSSSNDLKDP